MISVIWQLYQWMTHKKYNMYRWNIWIMNTIYLEFSHGYNFSVSYCSEYVLQYLQNAVSEQIQLQPKCMDG